MTLRTRWLTLSVAVVMTSTGCRSTCCRKASPPPVVLATAQPAPAYQYARPAAELLPPALAPVAPVAPNAPVAPIAPPPAIPPSPSNFAAPLVAPVTPPAPIGSPPHVADAPARLLAPEFAESATAEPPIATEATVKPAPPPSESKSLPAATLPVGIADFAGAIDNDRVTGGRKPTIEGLDWLKLNGYRTALLLRRPNETDDADRKQFTDRGLKFVALDVSAAGLTKAKSDEFNAIVGEKSGYPLFVYDADGALAGPLWYLYFRRIENLDDETARVRAGRLGLKTDATTGERAAMWQAVQRLLK